jgi:CMP-N-acetylneuraminic acid synthetase
VRKVNVFLPCRQGSVRVKNKNTRPIGNFSHGLVEIKINQLLNCNLIDKIFLSTNDEKIINFVSGIESDQIIIDIRDESLSSDLATTDSLIKYVSSLEIYGDILWTHVTSPFIDENTYDSIIVKYFSVQEQGYDSLMTVNRIQSFLWNEKGAINYNTNDIKWPRTQTINPIYEINSAVFIANKNIYVEDYDRIGKKPFLYELTKLEGFDIDWDDDFKLADLILKNL